MKTKQIVFTKLNTAELIDAGYEMPKENEVTVSLEYSAISSGTERANITGLRNGTNLEENRCLCKVSKRTKLSNRSSV